MRRGGWAYWEEKGKEPTPTGYLGLWGRMLFGTVRGLVLVAGFLGSMILFWYLVSQITGSVPQPSDTPGLP